MKSLSIIGTMVCILVAGGIEEGALVTAELNEAGAVIDLHRARP
ncbi:MAG TPA: hypothetical protein VJR03_05980 [Nitrospira sp.]|nr:hypothetical protein [Nitrospira sp.]